MKQRKILATLEHVLLIHDRICSEARAVVETKGHDYNRLQQKTGETLFNLKVPKLLGIVDTNTQPILSLMSNKLMRLTSLTRDPSVTPSVKNETIRDTIEHLINYNIYLYIVYHIM